MGRADPPPAAAGRATPESIARLRHFDQMTMVGTELEHYESNLAFHRELLLLSGNHELVDLVSEIRQRNSSATSPASNA